jgi:hypothetical protein
LYPVTGTGTSDYSDEFHIRVTWLQEIVQELQDMETGESDMVCIVGNVLWNALKNEAQVRSRQVEEVKGKWSFGIKEMTIDGMRVIRDPFLTTYYNTSMGQTAGSAGALERRLYILNLNDWEILIHPKRNFKMMPFFDQAQIANAADFLLGRVRFAGNLVCWHPNRSLYLSNIIP